MKEKEKEILVWSAVSPSEDSSKDDYNHVGLFTYLIDNRESYYKETDDIPIDNNSIKLLLPYCENLTNTKKILDIV